MLTCEIISIGTELLLGQIIDTNAAYIASKMAELGVAVYHKSVVGDNEERIAEVLSNALSRADLVITTGGLGPTMDDLTMEVISRVTGTVLVSNADVESDIRSFFIRINRPMASNNLKQALVPAGAEVIRNQVGTAPGIILAVGGKTIISMPGVPSEMRWMMKNGVLPYIRRKTAKEDGGVILSRVVKCFGIGESLVEDMIRDIMEVQSNPTIAPTASAFEVKLRITANASDSEGAKRLIEPVEKQLLERLGDSVFGFDDETMEGNLGELLRRFGLSMVTAESCTGGLIAKRLTDIPGSSDYFDRGYVTYSNKAKVELLGVPSNTLERYGAVSPETALAMAVGARERSRSDLAVSVTGIAGPGGGTAEKPVGLVYIGLAFDGGADVTENRFVGDRQTVRERTSQTAIDVVRKHIIRNYK